ncbi:uncharacterized protein LOC142327808 [Lycorma delicatula]|uniref:uncharacterized protein LOC142327808 n=1 Tax=Lycorma delicatula TaxID=130591 RepID=UPI003F517CE6
MTDAMSKKEKLARGSAVIKVMRVNPRPGHFLRNYIDPHKLPKKPKIGGPKGMAAEMPHLDVKNAIFEFLPKSARIPGIKLGEEPGFADICSIPKEGEVHKMGFGEGDKMVQYFGYRTWSTTVNPVHDGNLAEHFNIMLGLLISMAEDPENLNFADAEAYPCVQFLKTIKTPDGILPYNVGSLIFYIEYVAQKMLDEG